MNNESVNIFIGFDNRFPVAYHVLVQSILQRSSMPVKFTPINLTNLQGIFKREVDPLQSTQFSFSRFLTPYLSNYEGWSIFMDNDMIFRDDIAKLWDERDDSYAVMCVQHDYQPKTETKFLGATQTKYQKKNWSSMMLFNNAKCRALTPDFVNTATGLELHQFKWLENDDQIGQLPQRWNLLVDYHDDLPNPGCIHYTDGSPFYPEYENTGFSKEWFEQFRIANSSQQASANALVAAADRVLSDN